MVPWPLHLGGPNPLGLASARNAPGPGMAYPPCPTRLGRLPSSRRLPSTTLPALTGRPVSLAAASSRLTHQPVKRTAPCGSLAVGTRHETAPCGFFVLSASRLRRARTPELSRGSRVPDTRLETAPCGSIVARGNSLVAHACPMPVLKPPLAVPWLACV